MAGPAVSVEAGAWVCADVEFSGPHAVRVGRGCVLGPRCRVVAAGGPVELGPECVLEELVLVRNDGAAPLRLGRGNLLQVGAAVRCSAGELNVFEVRSSCPASAQVGSGCVVGATVELAEGAVLRDGAVAYRSAAGVRVRDGDAGALRDMHQQLLQRYTEILTDAQSKSALHKYHKPATVAVAAAAAAAAVAAAAAAAAPE
jgi:dynactin-6